MRFCWTTISVNSMKDSLDFYENIVGLKLNRRVTIPNGPDMAFLGEGETEIELIWNGDKAYEAISENISIGFQVDNLEDMMGFLEGKGIKLESPVIEPNPTTRFFFVKDPNGLRVQFVESK